MFKIAITNEFGGNEIAELPLIQRVGDTIPLFYKPYPKVKQVMLMPEKAFPDLKGIDAAITV